MTSQKDGRKMKAPEGEDDNNPAKRICTGGNKDGEKETQKKIELKRLEMSIRKKLGLLLDSIAAFVSYRNSYLKSQPGNSPSGTGSDGADDNRSANNSKDECPLS
ncbi:flagellar motor, putative [Babesia ovata]|uniref:Flagellar motor, putative n=1 Tax=Babesia ovata TaxID=189622 RepID=A0A2H6KFK9_9APIC|nr:flagellar motor, putative [Babesia ovata]GBE61749.1 flagellar motor, putative [Babesia ovata]